MEMTTGARANTHHVAIGLCILLLGVLLILDRLGIVGAEYTLRYWPIGLVIIGASVILQAFRGEPTTNASVPWGAIFWLLVLGFALSHVFERRAAAHADGTSGASIFAIMSGSNRTPHGAFTRGDITTVMGGARLDLRNVDARPGERMVLDVFTLMGGAVIFVPDNWNIDMQAMSVLGGIDDHRRGIIRGGVGRIGGDGNDDKPDDPLHLEIEVPGNDATAAAPPEPPRADVEKPADQPVEAETPSSTPPTLVIRGYVTLGGLQIKSR
jgi:hypothetical protein